MVCEMDDCSWHFVIPPLKRGAFRDLRFEELIRERVRVAVPPNHRLAQRRSVSFADAAQEPFVGLTRENFPDYHAYLAAVFAPVKNKPRVIEEHESMTGVISAIEAGTGVGLCGGVDWLQFRQSGEASATHSRTKTNFLRHRRAKRTT